MKIGFHLQNFYMKMNLLTILLDESRFLLTRFFDEREFVNDFVDQSVNIKVVNKLKNRFQTLGINKNFKINELKL